MKDSAKEILARQIDGRLVPVPADQFQKKTAVLGVAQQGGNVLIIPQFTGYDFPGGTVEVGESHARALVREFGQEAGYDIIVRQELARIVTYYTRHGNGRHYCQDNIVFNVEITGGGFDKIRLTDAEKAYMGFPQWVPFSVLEKMCFLRYPDDCDWRPLLQKIGTMCHRR